MVTMETGSVGSMTSYLASPYMVFCLLAVLGFYPFICKASVVCVDCSGPGCQHPGSCETNGKCFLRRDVNGLLYRGCADNQRWEGLDLGYNGCRWQHYLGWDYARVLWCLCHKPNCNNVTVGIFMLRDYSVHVQRPVDNIEQASRDHQALTKPDSYNEGSTQRGNETISNSNHTVTNTRVEWSKDSGSENGDGKHDGRNGEVGLESTQKAVDENGGRSCNMSIILCKLLNRDHIKDKAGSSDRESGDASTMTPIPFNQDNQKDSRTDGAQIQDPSPTPLDIASDRFTFGNTSSDEGTNHNADNAKGSQDEKYEHASTTASTMHEKTVQDGKNHLSLGDQIEGDNQPSKHPGTSLEGGSDSGLSNAYEARYEMDLDYEAEYADRMEDNQEGRENRELGSPQDGGAKTNNKDYRWLVNTDGSQPYEPIGPIDELDDNEDLNSNQGEPVTGGTGFHLGQNDSTKPQTGDGSVDDLSAVREPLPDNLQKGETEGYKLWDEDVRDGPQPLERHNEDRVGPQLIDSQERVREGPQPLNGQDGAQDGSVAVPLDSQIPTVISISETMSSSPTHHPLQTQAKCPSDFKVVPHLHSCYHVDRAPQTWQGAVDHCKRLDPRAHLVTIDRPGEYQYIVLKIAMEPKLMRGWQGWWTSGHYDVNIREFIWANTGHVISRLDPKWRHGLIVSPFSGTCVWFVPLAGFKIGNYGCQQPAGAICEIDL